MPYELKSAGKGKSKVCKKGGKKCFSKKPLPKAKAKAQMRAIYRSENMQKESFDQLVNGYLSKFIFEDAMAASVPPSATQPAKMTDPAVVQMQQAKKKKLAQDAASANKVPTEAEAAAFKAGAEAAKKREV